jgi:hypothetical protein
VNENGSKGNGTEYVVLKKTQTTADEPKRWGEVKTVTARSAVEAIRAAIPAQSGQEGTFIAVPARSFKPVTVKVEQTTRVRVGA